MDPALPPLPAAEIRVLGSLIEKAVTTPDYYPLSLAALTNACNQTTNRDPVVSFTEGEVERALDGLRAKNLATRYQGADSRIPRYKHAFTEVFLLTPAELAILCVLMLRGPQTVGELRTRTERLHPFDNLAEVEATLQALAARQPRAMVAKLPRQPGTKESRYVQLFSGPPETAAPPRLPPPEPVPVVASAENERLGKLEVEVAALRDEIAELRQQLAAFRKQFE